MRITGRTPEKANGRVFGPRLVQATSAHRRSSRMTAGGGNGKPCSERWKSTAIRPSLPRATEGAPYALTKDGDEVPASRVKVACVHSAFEQCPTRRSGECALAKTARPSAPRATVGPYVIPAASG